METRQAGDSHGSLIRYLRDRGHTVWEGRGRWNGSYSSQSFKSDRRISSPSQGAPKARSKNRNCCPPSAR